MKQTIIIAMLSISAGIAIAFNGNGLTTNSVTWTDHWRELSMPEAYNVALRELGSATNNYECFEAKRSPKQLSGSDLQCWFFTFSNTNGSLKYVNVVMNQDANRVISK
jgi:hypothetical protein